MPPAAFWSESASIPSEAGGLAYASTIGSEAIISAMPKKAWNGMPANSSSIRITYPGRCGPGSTPMIGQKNTTPTIRKCTIIPMCPGFDPMRKSKSGVKYSA